MSFEEEVDDVSADKSAAADDDAGVDAGLVGMIGRRHGRERMANGNDALTKNEFR